MNKTMNKEYNFTIETGNFRYMGPHWDKDGVVFTFLGEENAKEKCGLILKDLRLGETAKELILLADDSCRRGNLVSMKVIGAQLKHFGYRLLSGEQSFLDPYARNISGNEEYGREVVGSACYGLIPYGTGLSMTEERGPAIKKEDMVMYKAHVRGFTMDKGAKRERQGKFLGVCEKLSYLKELGVTTLELMPFYEFLEKEKEQEPLNYWGYKEGYYFSPKASYCVNPKEAEAEVKALIHSAHELGIEIIMEMFFPAGVPGYLVTDALIYWSEVYGVDGFHLLGSSMDMESLVKHPRLSGIKLFSEHFLQELLDSDTYGNRLYVYRDEYLYPARKMLNHIYGDTEAFLQQQRKQGRSFGFVNYLASNNGFSLMDVFSYNGKHNEANGEENADGPTCNFSYNYGVEGATRKKAVMEQRLKHWKNAMTMLFLAQGIPMIYQGDERANSNAGNNNPYCQDNPTGWMNWKKDSISRECCEFVASLTKLRRDYPLFHKADPFTFQDVTHSGLPDLSYHGQNAWIAQVLKDQMTVGLLYSTCEGKNSQEIYVGYNFASEQQRIALPTNRGKRYHPVFATGEASISDDRRFVELEAESIGVWVTDKE